MITTDIEIFLGLDVGTTDHWACTVTQDGTKIWNKTLPNDEAKLIEVYQKLLVQGHVLVIVDQPATIGALAVAVAQHLGIPVAYLSGLSMRRIADMYPGTVKRRKRCLYHRGCGPYHAAYLAGNKRLKRALFLSAFASIRFDPTSREYYDR